MDEWISIEDRLPTDDALVLVFWRDDDGWYVDIDYFEEEMWQDWFCRAEHCNIAGGNCKEEAPYTHWQPLPEPPK